MSISCCYSNCDQGQIDVTTGRAEVRCLLELDGPLRKKLEAKRSMKVTWSPSGEAIFHRACWEALLRSSRTVRAKNSAIKLENVEKQMIKDAAKTVELHDSEGRILQESKHIADLLSQSQHCVAFTGAGISTSAGIGDYRGKSGKWTLEGQQIIKDNEDEDGASPPKRSRQDEDDGEADDDNDDDDDGVAFEDLRPTYTHEALQLLAQRGYIKHIISQNGDGLHLLSGIPEDNLSELHGNVFIEKCENCCTRYHRPYYVMDDHLSLYYEELEDHGKTDIIKPRFAKQCNKCKLSHRTGRKCSKKGCKGYLMDSIINFRDDLEEAILDQAIDQATESDLMICLGSTLTVTPANLLVEMGQEPLRLVICNRQKTDVDKLCNKKARPGDEKTLGSRVFGDCDVIMREVMKCLIPANELQEWESAREGRMRDYNLKRTKTK